MIPNELAIIFPLLSGALYAAEIDAYQLSSAMFARMMPVGCLSLALGTDGWMSILRHIPPQITFSSEMFALLAFGVAFFTGVGASALAVFALPDDPFASD